MTPASSPRRSGPRLAHYGGVSLVGFAVDLAVVHLLLWLNVEPAWARVISLIAAMHVTLTLNALFVFKQWSWARLPAQWARYMLSNGAGNLCNYLIFVTMVSTHWPVIAWPTVAVGVGSFCAWLLNYAAARWFVFTERAPPSPDGGPPPAAP